MAEPLKLTPPAPRKKRKRVPDSQKIVDFSIPAALRRADEIMAGPCRGHLPRVPGRGELVQRFALPLQLVRPQNRTRGAQAWAMAALKAKVFRIMVLQHPEIRREPLRGRPLIRAIRFSSAEPDAMNDGFKVPIDILGPAKPPRRPGGRKKLGLGLIHDDAPRFVELASWWEYARPGEGFAILEVWSG